jgi:hypothetical protein
MVDKLVIYQKLYDAIIYAFPILNRMPKSQRFVLAQQIQNALLDAAKLITRANIERDKRTTLVELDVVLDQARLLIRIAHDLNLLSHRHYGQMAMRLNEIGRLLGGWRKQQEARQ